MKPSGVCDSSVIDSAMQGELLMTGFFEVIIDATLWLPGGLLANISHTAAFKSSTT